MLVDADEHGLARLFVVGMLADLAVEGWDIVVDLCDWIVLPHFWL